MSESKEVAAFNLVPNSLEELDKISSMLAKSQIVPQHYQNKPANVAVSLMWGQEIGLSPLQALNGIAVINGRGSLWGDAALAIVMAHKDFEDIEEYIEGEGDARVAVCIVKRKGRKPKEKRFSVQDAKDAFLWDTRMKVKSWKDNKEVEIINPSPWFRHQNRMLQMRARGFCLRDAFPDALRGINLVEETQGYDQHDPIDVTPAKSEPVNEYMPAATPQDEAVDAEFTEEPRMVTGSHELIDTATGEIITQEKPATDLPKTEYVKVGAGQMNLIEMKMNSVGISSAQMFESLGIRKANVPELSVEEGNRCLEWLRTTAGV